MVGPGGGPSFHELAEHADSVLWMFSRDWTELLFVNSAYERIYGRPTDELEDCPEAFIEAVHPEDRERVREAMSRISAGEAVDLEYRVNEAEGFGRRVWVEGRPIVEDGEVVRVAGVARDVTERHRRQDELERYATIVEATGDPVYTLDADGRFTFVNEALADLAGYDVEAFIGEHASMVLSEADVEEGESLIAELLREDLDRGTFEMSLRTADGRSIPCENHLAMLPGEDGFRGTVGVLRDISERRDREEELRRQVERFEAIFQTIPEPLVHVVFEGGVPVVRRINPTFTEVFGLTPEEVEGRSINEAIVPDDRTEEAREIDREARAGEMVEREVTRIAADGPREFRFRVNWFQAVGDEREAIGIYVDISDQKRRQRELERQNERLDEFASLVSHDLRNPLNVIQGRADLARRTGDGAHFEAIDRATRRMEVLIDDLLSLARAGATVRDVEPVDLGAVVRSCWANVDAATAALEVLDEVTVYADEGHLQQLLENLFANAVIHAGPDVTVTVGALADGFYVEDDGPGIPEAERGQVFEPGYTTAEDGTGFGLRIVRTVTDAHGWSLTLAEGEAGGARFEVTGVRTA